MSTRAAQEQAEPDGEPTAAPPALTLRDLLARQRGLRVMGAAWSLRSTAGRTNVIRATVAVVSGVLFAHMVAAHGINSWATIATAILVVGTIANFVFANVTALRLIAISEWIMRLGMGDLEYRVMLSGNDVGAAMCVALERVRDRSVRITDFHDLYCTNLILAWEFTHRNIGGPHRSVDPLAGFVPASARPPAAP